MPHGWKSSGLFAVILVVQPVDVGADPSGRAAVLHGQIELRFAVLEEGVLLRVDYLALEHEKVGHPDRVMGVKAPGQAQELVSLPGRGDGDDFDGHALRSYESRPAGARRSHPAP